MTFNCVIISILYMRKLTNDIQYRAWNQTDNMVLKKKTAFECISKLLWLQVLVYYFLI